MKSPPIICPMYCQSYNWWRSRKILWQSQNVWTLIALRFVSGWNKLTLYYSFRLKSLGLPKRPQKFEKTSYSFWHYWVNIKTSGRFFFQIMRPSHNILTLKLAPLYVPNLQYFKAKLNSKWISPKMQT